MKSFHLKVSIFRAENKSWRRKHCITNILITWAVVIVTAIVTFLCVRFGLGMTTDIIYDNSSSGTIYRTSDGRPVALQSSKVLMIPPVSTTTVNLTKNGMDPTSTFTSRQQLSNRSVIEFIHATTNRDIERDNRFEVGATISERTALLSTVTGNLTNTYPNRNRDNDVKNDEAEVNFNPRLYGITERYRNTLIHQRLK